MEVYHITPVNDLKEHLTDGDTCHCDPITKVDDNGIYIIHNSYDGREVKEQLIQDLLDTGIPN